LKIKKTNKTSLFHFINLEKKLLKKIAMLDHFINNRKKCILLKWPRLEK
jgi:hypothetical protein